MSIWKKPIDLETINQFSLVGLVGHLGIHITGISDTSMTATMPVDERTKQALGLLHGGASAALLETVASVAANWAVADDAFCVGVELNINHLRAKTEGQVHATARPLRLGRTIQVWNVDILDEKGEAVSSGRMTMAVRQR
ncbi:MAG: hotdog fold thioesterase [Bacteroidetes bacterium]|jgi:1,4-dihydroxy-2-naphthoyl-CoA hydrolase|nr:hotdog fold thioesterase [Bacteroidota bacterium]